MSLNPSTSFRRAGFALATVAGLMFSNAAGAQTAAKSMPVNAPASQTVDKAQCDAFFHYIANEARAFPDKLSNVFLSSALRFKRAGCAATDKDGEIQLITMNDQDAISLRTARSLMGTFDILGVSGVKGCARPPNGVCPANTSSATPKVGGG